MKITTAEIASMLNGRVEGDPTIIIQEVAKIEEAQSGAITFLSNPKYEKYLYTTHASAVLVNESLELTEPITPTLIRVDDAYARLAQFLNLVAEMNPHRQGIHPTANVSEKANVHPTAYIGPYASIGDAVTIEPNAQIYHNVYIGNRSRIGENTIIYPNATLYSDTEIGHNTIIHAGAVIGADGFGFAPQDNGSYSKIPQMGGVTIGNYVEIGANTTVDRASMGTTSIGDGTKIDNLVQVAHNVRIGENTVIAAQTGIAGSTRIGNNCVIAGQVGIVGHIDIPDRTQIGAQAGIANSIKETGTTQMGSPAFPIRNYYRSAALFKKLPDMNQEIEALKRRIVELEERLYKTNEESDTTETA